MKLKLFMIIAILAITTVPCFTQKVIDYRFPCQKDKTEMFASIEKIMKEEGLRFDSKKEERNGTVHYTYTTGIICEMPNYCYTTNWEYWYDDADKQIYAIPMQIRGATIGIYDSDSPETLVSYWNVRAKLEMLCSCKVIVTIYKPNSSMRSQTKFK